MVRDTPPSQDAPHIKFGIPTSKNIGDMHRTQSGTDGHCDNYKNEVKGQGQGHSDLKMVCDTPPSQDASTHQIWNSYLKEYRRYAPDTKRDGRTESAITICLPKSLWGHKIYLYYKTTEFHTHCNNCVSQHQKRWKLGYHPFWCKLIF